MSDPAEDFGDFMRDIGRIPIATREQVDAFKAKREAARTASTPSRLADSQLKDLSQQQAAGGPQPGDPPYRHYKTGGKYVVVARSLMEATLEPLVTYRSEEHGTYWTRPASNFVETVEAPDGSGPVPRFRRVEDAW